MSDTNKIPINMELRPEMLEVLVKTAQEKGFDTLQPFIESYLELLDSYHAPRVRFTKIVTAISDFREAIEDFCLTFPGQIPESFLDQESLDSLELMFRDLPKLFPEMVSLEAKAELEAKNGVDPQELLENHEDMIQGIIDASKKHLDNDE